MMQPINEKDQKKAFKTDTSISNSQRKERKLEKWHSQEGTCLEGEKGNSSSTSSLGSPSSLEATKASGWDQFETNEKLFGVKTSFDESLYTIQIDKSSKDYLLLEKKAEKLANDMLSRQQSSSLGSSSCRFRDVDDVNDDDEDEEDKFSSVIRPSEENSKPASIVAVSKLNFQAKEFVPSFEASSSSVETAIVQGEEDFQNEFSDRTSQVYQQMPYYNPYYFPYGAMFYAQQPPN